MPINLSVVLCLAIMVLCVETAENTTRSNTGVFEGSDWAVDEQSTTVSGVLTTGEDIQGWYKTRTTGGSNQSDMEAGYSNVTLSIMPDKDASVTSIAVPASEYLAYIIGVKIHLIWLPIMVPIGIVGNTLSFIVMVKRGNRHISCCLYMAGLALMDNCVLGLVIYFWAMLIGLLGRDINLWECKILTWLLQTFSTCSINIVIFMTIDRFVAVRYPLQASKWCTPKRAKITMVITFIVMILFAIPCIFNADIINKTSCVSFANPSRFIQMMAIINLCINSLLPFIILFILNIFIIHTMRQRNKYFVDDKKQTKVVQTIPEIYTSQLDADTVTVQTKETGLKRNTNRLQGKTIKSKETQLTIMLLCVTFALLALTFPMDIRFVVFQIVNYRQTPKLYSIYILLYHVTNKLYFTNHGVNFFLYCVGGSKFRAEIKALFCGKTTKSVANIGSRGYPAHSTTVD